MLGDLFEQVNLRIWCHFFCCSLHKTHAKQRIKTKKEKKNLKIHIKFNQGSKIQNSQSESKKKKMNLTTVKSRRLSLSLSLSDSYSGLLCCARGRPKESLLFIRAWGDLIFTQMPLMINHITKFATTDGLWHSQMIAMRFAWCLVRFR